MILQIKAAQDAVYSMPSTEIPPIFAASVDQEEESDSDVEIVGEVSAAKKRKVCTIELWVDLARSLYSKTNWATLSRIF